MVCGHGRPVSPMVHGWAAPSRSSLTVTLPDQEVRPVTGRAAACVLGRTARACWLGCADGDPRAGPAVDVQDR